MKLSRLALAFLGGLIASTATADPPLARLKVSDNKRFLVRDDGRPFFWLGDTAWELFHRLTREEAARYLDDRAKKGFTVIQAVAIAEFDGPTEPNSYGHLPLTGQDPAKPAVTDGPANDYWDHVDAVVAEANKRGLYVGFLPTWGRYWHDTNMGRTPIFTAANAEAYGEWLGKRYKDAGLVWILGGDRPLDNDAQKEIMRAMAKGLKLGDGGTHLMTWHPPGGRGSSQWLHDEPWLDFNMRQNGHAVDFTGRYDATRADYDRTPIKPVIDGEPVYEDHPVAFDAKKFGHSTAADVRRPLYWDLFTGACGHTYGHHSVWQFHDAKRGKGINNPLLPWPDAIQQAGAGQMQYGRWLIESRPVLTRIPDDAVLVPDAVPTAVPGAGRYRFAATRDADGTYAMVYAPLGRNFKVRMSTIKGPQVKAWWFNPRDGRATDAGTFPNTGDRVFVSPDPGETLDWVLVLDDAAKKYPAPGTK